MTTQVLGIKTHSSVTPKPDVILSRAKDLSFELEKLLAQQKPIAILLPTAPQLHFPFDVFKGKNIFILKRKDQSRIRLETLIDHT